MAKFSLIPIHHFKKFDIPIIRTSRQLLQVVLDLAGSPNFQVSNENHVIRIDLLDVTGPVIVPTPDNQDEPGTGVFKVVLDAGHGGKDPGAYSVNGRHRKNITWLSRLKLKHY